MAATDRRSRTNTTSTVSSLMQDVSGAYPGPSGPRPGSDNVGIPGSSNILSLSQAIHARRAEYVRPKHVRIKIGSWNVAAHKGAEQDIGGWFVESKGITEEFAGLRVTDPNEPHRGVPDQTCAEERETVAAQEARYAKKQSTIPKGDPGRLPGGEDVGLYVLGLQEIVDISSFTEALRPYTDSSAANKFKAAMNESLPEGYTLVAEQQLIGMLLLVYASADVAREIKSVSTTSVGTGIAGYMGNKGAVTARIVLGETTRIVFVNCHMSAGADKAALERRNWDAHQIVTRTRFAPIKGTMDLEQATGEQIGDEDFAFWCGDLNYRLEGIPGDDVRRLLMLHTRNAYDLSQRSAEKIEGELESTRNSVERRVENRLSSESANSGASSTVASPRTATSCETRTSTESTAPTLLDEVSASEDPTSLQTTISSLLPHDELRQQMKARKAFHDGWREGPITFLPSYKYDAGSVGVFDSSEKKRAPSWCDRILYRTRKDKLAFDEKIREEEEARKRDEEMRANGTDQAADDESILYDYDPDTDGVTGDEEYDEHEEFDHENGRSTVITKEGFEDEICLEYYTTHQRVLSSDHKPLSALFSLKYDAVVPELKAKVHAEVAKELDKAENEGRADVTVVVDKHKNADTERDDAHCDPEDFEGVWFGDVRWAQAKHRTLTIANTGRVPANFSFISRPVSNQQSEGVAPKWINLKINEQAVASSSVDSPAVLLDPGETAVVELEVRVFDLQTARSLNEGVIDMDDILVLRVEGGRDHFIPVRGKWMVTSLGHSIDKLIRIPEGGIRKLQGQKPDSSKSGSGSKIRSVDESGSDSSGGGISGFIERVASPVTDNLPVRFSAPRELFRLTEAVEHLATRVIAEWEMTHPVSMDLGDDNAELMSAPWLEHPAWPFEEDQWVGRETATFYDALGSACDAVDEDRPIEASLPAELPALQKLYVLANLLLLLLRSMPDGVISADLWSKIDTYLLETEKVKPKPCIDDQRTAIQEVLVTEPNRSISVILITSMIECILQELAATVHGRRGSGDAEPPISPGVKKSGPAKGTIRKMAALGKLPTSSSQDREKDQTREVAMGKVFAGLMIRTPDLSNEKQRAALEKRKVWLIGLFLNKEHLM